MPRKKYLGPRKFSTLWRHNAMMPKLAQRKPGTWQESLGRKVSWTLQGKKGVDLVYKKGLPVLAGLALNKLVQPPMDVIQGQSRTTHLVQMTKMKWGPSIELVHLRS